MPVNAHPKICGWEAKRKRNLPPFRVGDQVAVHYRIREGDRERIQVFQGIVIRRARGGMGATFTVRKVSFGGIGVERIFPEHSPFIEKLEVISRGAVRRARLYYLRGLEGKAARVKQEREPGANQKG
ncbi:MAG: 50S ribosomal protein L19 [Sandaracinaceae bacterium]|nr:50S ribosomal protein L19 [Sandaracinaceae bacterium]